jgi:hypothetical protein
VAELRAQRFARADGLAVLSATASNADKGAKRIVASTPRDRTNPIGVSAASSDGCGAEDGAVIVRTPPRLRNRLDASISVSASRFGIVDPIRASA